MEPADEEEISDAVKNMMTTASRQNASERRDIRLGYEKLINDAQKEKEKERLDLGNVMMNLEEADSLYNHVCRPREAILDAKLLNIHGEIISKKINTIRAGVQFVPTEFLSKLAIRIRKSTLNVDPSDILSSDDWVELGKRTSVFINRTPSFNFIHGSFVHSAEISRPQRRARDPEEKTKPVELIGVSGDSQKLRGDVTNMELERIKGILHRVYAEEGRPLCYIKFLFDPDDFTATVMNMFHFSFLLNKGEARVFLSEIGTYVIEPITGNRAEGTDQGDRNSYKSSVVTINKELWMKLVKAYKVTKATIPKCS